MFEKKNMKEYRFRLLVFIVIVSQLKRLRLGLIRIVT